MMDREAMLERAFLDTALKRSELLRQNEPKKANKEYDKLHRLKGEMRHLPDKGKAALKRVAGSTEDDDVRILAAAALLAIDEPFATELLEQIQMRGVGIPSFTAEMTLHEWQAGSIKDYWS